MPKRLRFHRRTGGGETIDHRESIPGQSTPTLCGWDGGQAGVYVAGDGTPECRECAAIYRWAGGR